MDHLFRRLCEENTPKMNAHVMNGLACSYMDRAEEYLDNVIRSASKSFPPGLVYHTYERCTPHEEYEEVTRPRNTNRRSFDLAKSSLYLVKYKFSFNGKPIKDRYVYLPYADAAGTFYMSGSLHHFTPVLSDKVISPGSESIFVRLLRDRVIFKRTYQAIVVNGISENSHVVWSPIYRNPPGDRKAPVTTRALTCIPHYLFAKFGFQETFQKYAGFTPVFGYEEINSDTYPDESWLIVQTTGNKPVSYIGSFYEPTKIRLAIPVHMWTPITKALVLGFFYVADNFPEYLTDKDVSSRTKWMILLGHIVFSGSNSYSKLITGIEEHFRSLDDYMDTIIHEKLLETGRDIETFYDLLATILAEFDVLVQNNNGSNLSMFGKSLEILYYALYDITRGIFKTNFKLGKRANKRPLTVKDVEDTFGSFLKQGAIFGLSSGKIIAESVSYSGDHYYPKITSRVNRQEGSAGASRGSSKRQVVGEDQKIDISMAEAGSILFLSKANPTPAARLNCFVTLDMTTTCTIIPNPEFEEIRQETQRMLLGK